MISVCSIGTRYVFKDFNNAEAQEKTTIFKKRISRFTVLGIVANNSDVEAESICGKDKLGYVDHIIKDRLLVVIENLDVYCIK